MGPLFFPVFTQNPLSRNIHQGLHLFGAAGFGIDSHDGFWYWNDVGVPNLPGSLISVSSMVLMVAWSFCFCWMKANFCFHIQGGQHYFVFDHVVFGAVGA
ncbi:MAG: hypothetical protein R2795_15985 [Saprospiraceae bacterium]